MILPKDKYIETVRRAYPPLWSSLIMTGAAREDVHKAFFTKPYARLHTVVCDYVWWYPITTEERAKQLIGQEWADTSRLKRVVRIFREREKKILAVAKKKNLSDIFSAYEEYMPALNLGYLAEFPFFAQLKKVLLKKVSKKEAEYILDGLNIPIKDNFYKKEEYELARGEDLKTHIRKYEWILSRYGSDTPYTEHEAKKKRVHINRTKFLEKYRKEKKNVRLVVSQAKKIIGPKYAFLVDAFQFFIFFRTHRTDIMNKVSYLCIPQLKDMARDHGISYEEILFSTKDELLARKIPSRSVLRERMKGHAMVILKDGVHCLTGEAYKKVKAVFKEQIKEVVEISGMVASRGLVSGRVKVVMGRSDITRVKNGDILVANMTTPEMVPAMKKAAAFITDEGGVTCHAAIISREMKKPCIIGTKIATKVLKDGDLVEVDANKGVVKVINKENRK